MKVFLSLAMPLLVVFTIMGCRNDYEPAYSDNEPLVIDLNNDSLKILQLTDLHLTYTIDANDRRTFNDIEQMVLADDYDLVVFTGDIVMSPFAPSQFRRLRNLMESLAVPWTFVFGNHDRDYQDAWHLIAQTDGAENLYFKVGPELEDGGVGNFSITFNHLGVPFYHAHFLDSKAELENPNDETGVYDYFSDAQVAWFEARLAEDVASSLVFMHTPLRQFELVSEHDYVGDFLEPVHPQGIDTGFFDVALNHGNVVAMFAGHDHLNTFVFELDGIVLAYGKVTGHNAYGFYRDTGGRVIHITNDGSFDTWIINAKGERIDDENE